jgi:multiple sugar transport system substrate-binding protein
MTTRLTRRSILGAGLAAGLATAPAAGRRGHAQARTRLRLTFWGNPDRARRTQAAIEAYQRANPAIEIASESAGWGDYWTRLATQVAGGNAPDVIQMDYRYIFEYARRRAIKPLDGFMPGVLDIRDFGANNIDCGKVDGQLFGVNWGVNSTAMFYDKAQFAERVTELARKERRRGFFGSADAGSVEPLLEAWVRQRGKALYTPEGRLGFARDDLAEFWDYWDRLRRAGAAVPGELQALYRETPETDMMTLGHAATAFQHSNQLVAWQGVIRAPLGITMFPQGSRPGQYYKPAMLISVAATTPQAEEAARLVNFLAVSPAATRALGVERGVPCSAAARNLLLPDADPLAKAMIEYIALIADKVGPLPPPPPRGAGENQQLLRRIYETITVGGARVPEAADRFMAEAQRVLERAG